MVMLLTIGCIKSKDDPADAPNDDRAVNANNKAPKTVKKMSADPEDTMNLSAEQKQNIDKVISKAGDINIALIEYVRQGNAPAVNYLISRGADVDAISPIGRRPLHQAAFSLNLDMVKLLISHDADINALTDRKVGGYELHETALELAAQRNNRQIVDFLVEHGAAYRALEAAAVGDEEGLKRILAADSKAAHETDGYGRNALHWAARNGYAECAAIILDAGVDVNIKSTWLNRTPLHYVAEGVSPGHIQTARLLLERGASLGIQDYGGKVPLQLASIKAGSRSNATEMTELLTIK
jgi:ankyrin repeat protein